MRHEVLFLAHSKMDETRKLAYEEFERILTDERRQPITYNHYCTDNIQNAWEVLLKSALHQAIQGRIRDDWNGKFHVSNSNLDT